MGLLELASSLDNAHRYTVVGALVLTWVLYTFIYNLCWTSLKRYPGPLWWKLSRIPGQLSVVRGYSHREMAALHERYGPVVRTGPHELAFNTPQAFRDIYGSHAGKSLPKPRSFYPVPTNGVENLPVAIDDEVHARHRKLLAYGLSDRALREQEGLILGLINKLAEQFTDAIQNGKGEAKVNMEEWMNFTIFDITGELTFGEPFGCLKSGKLHPWISLIFSSIQQGVFLTVVKQFPWSERLLKMFIPKRVNQEAMDHFNMVARQVDRRLASKTERSDFMTAILKGGLSEDRGVYRGPEKMMTRDEVHSNAVMIILAGSETSATLLSGCFYLLCTHPSVMKTLIEEIHSTLTEDDITINKTAKLPYLNAVIEESLRMYSPVTMGLRRLVPKGGVSIDGHFVPENTLVSCHSYASFHSPSNFASPYDFIPERWLGTDPRFDTDKKSALQPFSVGPRSCIGKRLALTEIRLVLCKLLFHFDISLCPESANWIDQKAYFIWDKPPLWVALKERQGGIP